MDLDHDRPRPDRVAAGRAAPVHGLRKPLAPGRRRAGRVSQRPGEAQARLTVGQLRQPRGSGGAVGEAFGPQPVGGEPASLEAAATLHDRADEPAGAVDMPLLLAGGADAGELEADVRYGADLDTPPGRAQQRRSACCWCGLESRYAPAVALTHCSHTTGIVRRLRRGGEKAGRA